MSDLPPDVRQEIERLDGVLRSQRTLATKLEAVSELVQATVPACDGASVSLVVEEASFTGAASSQLAIEADLAQYRHDEGPCLTAVSESSTVRIDLLHHDERFQHFAPIAIEMGVESVLSIPLLSGGAVVGSLNMYSTQADAFDDDVPEQVAPLTDYAAGLIVASPVYASALHLLRRLLEVVDDSAQMEIAVGILIVREDLTPAAAWQHLSRLAADDGSSVVEVARRMVARFEADRTGPRGPGPVAPQEP